MKFQIAISTILSIVILTSSCHQKYDKERLAGKIKKETVTFAPKVTGRILKIYVKEGDNIKPGDTLAMLDVPEVNAKVAQARGAVKAATAQNMLADNGATRNQLKQVHAKYGAASEQYQFAKKTYDRATAMYNDSLISPQSYDEIFSKYKSARAQLDAVSAELNEAAIVGTRIESKLTTQGQQDQATAALAEIEVAYSERYIIATNYMALETIALREGELATAAHPIFSGFLPASTWFRFTVPESKISPYKKGLNITVNIPYKKLDIQGKIATIKQMPRYADISTAYPDYEMDDAVYEIKIIPNDSRMVEAEDLLFNATIVVNKSANKL
ncbi:MAG: secretion protein HlyD family protein [Sphingobacterium sp.]|jgi:HlyD family secretion protein|nr:secretion protein HlyD family protein [Sphingobacterium sp.]